MQPPLGPHFQGRLCIPVELRILVIGASWGPSSGTQLWSQAGSSSILFPPAFCLVSQADGLQGIWEGCSGVALGKCASAKAP